MDYFLCAYTLALFFLSLMTHRMKDREKYGLSLRWFGYFTAILYINEISELIYLGLDQSPLFNIHRAWFVLLSSLCLIEFCRRNTFLKSKKNSGLWIYILFSLVLIPGWFIRRNINDFLIFFRYFLAFPACVWVTLLFLKTPLTNGQRPVFLRLSGIIIFLFSLTWMLDIPKGDFFPANLFHASSFRHFLGFPLEFIQMLLFLSMAILVYIHYWDSQRSHVEYIYKKLKPYSIPQFILTFVFIGTVSFFATNFVGLSNERKERENILYQVKMVAAAVDPADYRSLSQTLADLNNPCYQSIRAQLMQMQRADPRIRWLYLMSLDKKGILFTVDSIVLDDPGHVEPGADYYHYPPAELLDVFKTGRPVVSEPYTDEYGSFISAFTPIRDDRTQEIIAVAGLDINADIWERNIRLYRLSPVLIGKLFALLVLFFFLYRQRQWEDTQQLKFNERHLAKAQELANFGSWIFDIQTDRFRWSPEMFMILDFYPYESPPDINKLLNRLHPEDRNKVESLFKRIVDIRSENFEIEARLVKLDNTLVHTLSKVEIKRDDQKKITQIIGVTQDITAIRKAEEAVKESEARYRSIFNSTSDGLIIFDLDGNITEANPQACKMHGYSYEEMIRLTGYDIIPPDHHQAFRHFPDMTVKLSGYTLEAVSLRKDKSIFQMEVRGAPFEYRGKPHILSVMRDITEEKMAEEQILQAQKRLQDIINFLPDATFVIDLDGKVIAWNMAIEQMTNIKREDILGKGDYEYAIPFYGEKRPILIDIAKEGRRDLEERYSAAGTDSGHIFGEAFTPKIYNSKGAFLWGTASRLFDEKGNCIGAIESIRDITERKRLEQQLIQSEKLSAVGQLAAGIAHEFNNILAVISGMTQLMQMDNVLQQNKEIMDNLRIIEEETKRGANIVSNIVAFSRPAPLKKEFCNISEIIDEVIHIQKKQFELENIVIRTEYKHAFQVNIDRSQMLQVFLNLFLNARHAIRHHGKGEITVTTADLGKNVEIVVRDTGIGMDDETRAKLFTPFFTTKGAMAQDSLGIKGTGLGLAITYSIINNHNGNITVESRKTAGTSFVIQLPGVMLNSEQIKEVEELNKEVVRDESIKEMKILIIDDDKQILSFMDKLLRKAGLLSCSLADSGKEALSLFQSQKFDIIFLDMLLPDMNGEQIIKALKKIDPLVPVVIISGKQDMSEYDARSLGAISLIRKPFSFKDLLNALYNISVSKNT
ncbi:MAG: PAS domain S-box protein [bacterium]|nr:PAS domain S-box protein [bacterium]